jgi:hypothetical protein
MRVSKRVVFAISRGPLGPLGEVYGRSYEDAAKAYAKRVYGRRATAFRTTGTFGLSGYFRAYLPVPGSGGASWESVGDAFHVGGGE